MRLAMKEFRKVHMAEDHAASTLQLLLSAIQEIHSHNASGLSFEELYRNAYNMVLHKYGGMLYSALKSEMVSHLEGVADGVAEVADQRDFVVAMDKAWSDHSLSVVMIRDILLYMDRLYVVAKGLKPVFELGLELFTSTVLSHPLILTRLPAALLDLIEAERKGKLIDRPLLKRLADMYVSLGADSRSVYVEHFETPYLAASTAFYRNEALEVISSNSAPAHMAKAQERLAEERARVAECLDAGSLDPILGVVDHEYIGAHADTLLDMEGSGLVAMLANDRYDELALTYALFGRIPDGHARLLAKLSQYIVDQGRVLVQDKVLETKAGAKKRNPKVWVAGLLQAKDKYDLILERAFGKDRKFKTVINKAFETFINLNPRSPEYISLFIDSQLKKGLKGVSEDEADAILDKTMILFRFLEDKDVFETYYKQHLSRRLIGGRSISDDAEQNMIAKLKAECGFQFTSKLEGMFTDMTLSTETMAKFNVYLDTHPKAKAKMDGMDLSVHVLTKTFWPTREELSVVLPASATAASSIFEDFYLSQHTGRTLTWQSAMGTATVKATFDTGSHELVVSTIQMCLLDLFNVADSYTFAELRDIIQPSVDDYLIKGVLALTTGKQRILIKTPKSKSVNDDDTLTFNSAFKSKLFRVKILQVAAKRDTAPQIAATRRDVEEGRKHAIEAAIVRVMKARQTMQHNNLIAEVIKRLAKRFKAEPTSVKRRLESLIEREYIARGKNRKTYEYLA